MKSNKVVELLERVSDLRSTVNVCISLVDSKSIDRKAIIDKLNYIEKELKEVCLNVVHFRQSHGSKISKAWQKKRDEYVLIFCYRNGHKRAVVGWDKICEEAKMSEAAIRQRLAPGSKLPCQFVDEEDGEVITIKYPRDVEK